MLNYPAPVSAIGYCQVMALNTELFCRCGLEQCNQTVIIHPSTLERGVMILQTRGDVSRMFLNRDQALAIYHDLGDWLIATKDNRDG